MNMDEIYCWVSNSDSGMSLRLSFHHRVRCDFIAVRKKNTFNFKVLKQRNLNYCYMTDIFENTTADEWAYDSRIDCWRYIGIVPDHKLKVKIHDN